MPIVVEQGDEYPGETYIFCTSHLVPEGVPSYTRGLEQSAVFEGWSRAELEAFLAAHKDC